MNSYRFFLLSALSLCQVLAFAQLPDVSSLEKENKSLIKKAKKQSWANDAWIEIAPDGYWYIKTSSDTRTNGCFSAYNQNGDCIYSSTSECGHFLEYLPAMQFGFSSVPDTKGKPSDTFTLSHPDVKGTFLVRTREALSFITPEGKEIRKIPLDSPNFTIYPGWVAVHATYGETNNRGYVLINGISGESLEGKNNISFYTSDGKLFIDNILNYTVDNEQNFKYSRLVNGVKKMGLKNLIDPGVDIPCQYATVFKDSNSGQWFVGETSESPTHPYTISKENSIQYRDEGERLYEAEEYEKVIKYYSTEGTAAPWAKYFTGASLEKLAANDLLDKKKYITLVENAEWSNLNNIFYNKTFMTVSIDTDEQMLHTARRLLQEYASQDSNQLAQLAQISLDGCNEYLNLLTEIKPQYERSLLSHKEHDAYEKAKVEKRLQEQAQQSAYVLGMMQRIIGAGFGSSPNNQTNVSIESATTPANNQQPSVSKKPEVETASKCSHCHGTGSCTACHGHPGKATAGSDRKCSGCNGSGRCTYCQGTGYRR